MPEGILGNGASACDVIAKGCEAYRREPRLHRGLYRKVVRLKYHADTDKYC